MSLLRVTLEQWQALLAVVDEGSYANASKKLHKSQPTLSYLINKIEESLDVCLFDIVGRKAIPTTEGKQLYAHAHKLINFAYHLENYASNPQRQYHHQVRLVVDEIYPMHLLMDVLNTFDSLNLNTQIILTRGILSGPLTRLKNNQADIAITFERPNNKMFDHILRVTSIACAGLNHPLHQQSRLISEEDLLNERQIIVMDSAKKEDINVGWLTNTYAWYVDSLELKLQLLVNGLGFAWLNQEFIEERGLPLKPLLLANHRFRYHDLYLAHRALEELTPPEQALIEIFKQKITLVEKNDE